MNNNKIEELEMKLYELKHQRRIHAFISLMYATFCGNSIGMVINTDSESQKVANMILAFLMGYAAIYDANVVRNDTLEMDDIKRQQKVLTKEDDSHN